MAQEEEIIMREFLKLRRQLVKKFEKSLKFNPNDPPTADLSIATTNGKFYKLYITSKIEIGDVVLKEITADDYLDDILDAKE